MNTFAIVAGLFSLLVALWIFSDKTARKMTAWRLVIAILAAIAAINLLAGVHM
jgi:di/tricarboxylate transporter